MSIRGDRRVRRQVTCRRNTHRRRERIGLPVPPAWMVAGSMLVVAGLAYVSLVARTDALGVAVRTIEGNLVEQRRLLQDEQQKWARLTAPESIERALDAFGLQMDWPRPDQVARLSTRDSIEAAQVLRGAGDRSGSVQVAQAGGGVRGRE